MSKEKQIVEMDLVVLNCYRNKYYNDGNSTEEGILANAINNVLPALVLLKELQHKYELAVAEREANVKGFTEELSKAKTEVAREILREVRQALLNMVLSNSMGETYDIEKRFAEIEKKYTERENNENI